MAILYADYNTYFTSWIGDTLYSGANNLIIDFAYSDYPDYDPWTSCAFRMGNAPHGDQYFITYNPNVTPSAGQSYVEMVTIDNGIFDNVPAIGLTMPGHWADNNKRASSSINFNSPTVWQDIWNDYDNEDRSTINMSHYIFCDIRYTGTYPWPLPEYARAVQHSIFTINSSGTMKMLIIPWGATLYDWGYSALNTFGLCGYEFATLIETYSPYAYEKEYDDYAIWFGFSDMQLIDDGGPPSPSNPIPPESTSINKLMTLNDNIAFIWYSYLGANYKDVLIKGTGNIWYAFGRRNIKKVMILGRFAYVYIGSNKYILRDDGSNLHVYS